MSDQRPRTKIDRPLNVSCENNSPTPPLNDPIKPLEKVPRALLTKVWLHCRPFGSYRNNVRPSQWPFGPSASISSNCARPPQILRTETVPFNSNDSADPENGFRIR